jgi:hypothetical protein
MEILKLKQEFLTRAQCYNTFYGCDLEMFKYVRVFAFVRNFLSCKLFVGVARAYPRVEHLKGVSYLGQGRLDKVMIG